MRRRHFIRNTALACSALVLRAKTGLGVLPAPPVGFPDLAVSGVRDPYKSALAAIDALGGIGRFVKPGEVLGFLINSDFDVDGTYVNPDIPIAVIEQCMNAGARQIILLQPVKEEYWKRSIHYKSFSKLIPEMVQIVSNVFPAVYNDQDFVVLPKIDGAVYLKDLETVRKVSEIHRFINIPIGKHHASTLYTGALKNMMGLNTRKSNVNFHLGSGTRNDPDYLAQCIADMALVRKPDLVVSDSIRVLASNGPGGPGEVITPGKVVTGTDPVAVDAYGAKLMGYHPEDVLTLVKARDLGVGRMDLEQLTIQEIS
jgi:uncharacterized protein (DUF362 family)